NIFETGSTSQPSTQNVVPDINSQDRSQSQPDQDDDWFGVGGDRLLARLFLLVDFEEDDVISGDRFLTRLIMLVDFEEDDVIGGN
ncbi:hypothetical protein Tco_1519544, partial [Tanacetum coccineum]